MLRLKSEYVWGFSEAPRRQLPTRTFFAWMGLLAAVFTLSAIPKAQAAAPAAKWKALTCVVQEKDEYGAMMVCKLPTAGSVRVTASTKLPSNLTINSLCKGKSITVEPLRSLPRQFTYTFSLDNVSGCTLYVNIVTSNVDWKSIFPPSWGLKSARVSELSNV